MRTCGGVAPEVCRAAALGGADGPRAERDSPQRAGRAGAGRRRACSQSALLKTILIHHGILKQATPWLNPNWVPATEVLDMRGRISARNATELDGHPCTCCDDKVVVGWADAGKEGRSGVIKGDTEGGSG
jgi:hypothetical protein